MHNRSTLYSRYFTYIKPITKLPIVKNYGSTILSLLVITILIYFAIKPTVETILVLQKKIADADAILQKVTQKANNLSLGKKNYDNLDQKIKDKISAAIPDSINLKSISQTLEQTTKNHEASVSALQIQPFAIETKITDKLGVLAEAKFTFNAEGNYNNLTALLQDLKTSNRLISIDSLSLSKTSDSKSLILSLSGKAFYLK
ncbi:MAG: type 4a pilus biogenesis protein PilO [Candidatus Daviesbacteria bacterium]|nr:type 4a pilus biogenesis protein PilO [Candidatus Daviesbacteria bacterium]